MGDITKDYSDFLNNLKSRITRAHQQAARTVNQELILLYWDIGKSIIEKQNTQGWGKKIIQQLSLDLGKAFPEMKGFSERNLDYMRHLVKIWPEKTIVQQLVAKLPWGHIITLIHKLPNNSDRLWYARQTLENGWSRNVLLMQIESNLKIRSEESQKTHNFATTLPPSQFDLAQATLKDPYIFDFLTIGEQAHEREIEKALIDHIQKFLLELGAGFA